MKKTILSLMSLGLAGLTLLTACSGGGASPAGDTAAASTTTSETTAAETEFSRNNVSDDLPAKDFKGKELNVISRTNFTFEFLAEEENGDTINDAVFSRNRTVKERFNAEIKTHAYGEGNAANVMDPLKTSVLAGDDAYQLGSAYTYRAAPSSVEGYYFNWYELPYINLEKPWWSKGFVDEATVNGKVFLATGDLSLLFNQVVLGIFFNKEVAESYKIPDLYATVKDEGWTFDKMIEYCKTVAGDVDGDGKMTEKDRWGIGFNRYTHIDCFLYAFQVPVTKRNADGVPEIVINSEKMANVVTKLNTFINESGTAWNNNDGIYSLPEGVFEENRALFMSSWLGHAEDLRAMESDFGIIPYPKWDAAQDEYSTYYLDRASSFVIPITTDKEFTCLITEAMAAESYKQVIPAFYETALKTKYSRDDDSQAMIDLILQNIRFDFGNIYVYALGSTGPGHILRTLIWNKDTNFQSAYASYEAGYKVKMAELLEEFK